MLGLSWSVYETILDHAERDTPAEVCGILGGDYGNDVSYALSVEPAENVAETPSTTYRIDPTEQLELMKAIEETGADIVGFYHSHPSGPPRPSATDAAQATWTDRSYLIVTLTEGLPVVDSWRWNGEQFRAETVRIC